MSLLTKFSESAKTSLVYITLGALILVWTGVRLGFLFKHPPANETTWYWTFGFLGTGLVFLLIGFALGRIGRAARHAELPPEEVTPSVARIQETAAGVPIVMPNAPAVSAPAPNQNAAVVAAPAAMPMAPAVTPTPAPLPVGTSGGSQVPLRR